MYSSELGPQGPAGPACQKFSERGHSTIRARSIPSACQKAIASSSGPSPSSSSPSKTRSEEHTSELQSQSNIVCRLLLEKKQTMGVGACGRTRFYFPPRGHRARIQSRDALSHTVEFRGPFGAFGFLHIFRVSTAEYKQTR